MVSRVEERPIRILDLVSWLTNNGSMVDPLIKARTRLKKTPFITPNLKFRLKYLSCKLNSIRGNDTVMSAGCQEIALFF